MEWEEGRRKKTEELERLKAEEQKRKDEEARFERLLKDAKDWQTSYLLRFYIKAVRENVDVKEQFSQNDTDLQKWLEWAEGKADDLDQVLNSQRP